MALLMALVTHMDMVFRLSYLNTFVMHKIGSIHTFDFLKSNIILLGTFISSFLYMGKMSAL